MDGERSVQLAARRQRRRVRPRRLVGGAGAPARGERCGHRLGRGLVVRRDLEGPQPILERRLLLPRPLAPPRRLEVRLRGRLRGPLPCRPGGDRPEQLARHRVRLVEALRVLERVDRPRHVVRAREQHRDLDQRARHPARPLRVAEAPQRLRRHRGLAHPRQPPGELAAEHGVVSQRERTLRERRGPIELDDTRCKQPGERDRRLALPRRVPLRSALLDARAQVGRLGPRTGVARHGRLGVDPLQEQRPRRHRRRALHQLRRRHGPARLHEQ